MPRVASSVIDRVIYDDAAHDLVVVFHGTGAYLYSNVPKRLYAALLAAASKGRFFNESIRGRFPCEPLGARPRRRMIEVEG